MILEWIRERIKDMNYAQLQVIAEKADISRTTLVNVRKGMVSPTVEKMEEVVKALGGRVEISVVDTFPVLQSGENEWKDFELLRAMSD